MAATRTAREVVELYNLVVWNQCSIDLAEGLFADTVIRHEVGEATLTREQAVNYGSRTPAGCPTSCASI